MNNFHAKDVATNSISESFIDDIVQGTYGFHFYDIPNIYANNYGNTSTGGLPNNPNNWESQLNDAHLLLEYQNDGHIIHYYEEPTAIYVRGGPVRIHGTYKGQWTVVTDESTPYHRHAWGSGPNFPGPEKIDTLWNNIWLIGDIVNADYNWYDPPGARQSYKSLRSGQPEEVNLIDCEGESENVLGIVSGANVYVTNTAENGAKNQSWGRDIDIHAHIIAFNESFAVHYFQNNISDLNYRYSEPDPFGGTGSWADGQGRNRWGLGGGTDNRGYINLWGGVVQKFRGYAKRNNGGGSAYQTFDIGMDKNYNFDCNLKCNFPPLYPENIESSSCGELEPEKKSLTRRIILPLTGVVFTLIGAFVWLPFGANAVLFLAALIVLSGLRGDFAPPVRTRRNWRAELCEGLTFLRDAPFLQVLAVVTATWNLCHQMVVIGLILHVQENLGLDATIYGLILGAGAVGGRAAGHGSGAALWAAASGGPA